MAGVQDPFQEGGTKDFRITADVFLNFDKENESITQTMGHRLLLYQNSIESERERGRWGAIRHLMASPFHFLNLYNHNNINRDVFVAYYI